MFNSVNIHDTPAEKRKIGSRALKTDIPTSWNEAIIQYGNNHMKNISRTEICKYIIGVGVDIVEEQISKQTPLVNIKKIAKSAGIVKISFKPNQELEYKFRVIADQLVYNNKAPIPKATMVRYFLYYGLLALQSQPIYKPAIQST